MPFNVGDKVKVVRAPDNGKLKVGDVHTVKAYNADRYLRFGGAVDLEGPLMHGWHADRFELYVEPAAAVDDGVIRVRCIEGKRGTDLRNGQVYTIKKEFNTTYLLNEIPHVRWKKARFELVVNAPVAVKKPPRMVKPDGSDVEEGDKLMLVAVDRQWATGHNLNLKDTIIGVCLTATRIRVTNRTDIGAYIQLNGCEGYGSRFDDRVYVPFKDLAFYEGGAITKKAPPAPEPALPDIREALKKLMKDEAANNICSFGWLNKGEKTYHWSLNYVCFAQIRQARNMQRFAVSMKNPYVRLDSHQHDAYNRWFSYVYNDSPFASCFIKTSVEDAIENGYELDTSKPLSQLLGAATAVRVGHEFQNSLKVFTFLLDEGFSGNTAFLCSRLVQFNGSKFVLASNGNGHDIIDNRMDVKQLFKFFREGYYKDAGLPANQSGGEYKVLNAMCDNASAYYGTGNVKDEDQLGTYVKANCPTTKAGRGWDADETITEENFLKFAKLIETQLTEQQA